MRISEASREWDLSKRAIRLLCKKKTISAEKHGLRYSINKSQKKPTYKELRSINYEPVECPTIFTQCRKYYRGNTPKARLFIILLVICITLFFIDFPKDSNYALSCLILNALYSIMIQVFLFLGDVHDNIVNDLQYAFPGKNNYKSICKNFYNRLSAASIFYKGVRAILRKKPTAVEKEHKRNLKQNVSIVILWLVYCFVWIAALGFLVWFAFKRTTLFASYSGKYALLLFLISMSLISQSYYGCVVSVLFYQRLSSLSNRIEVKRYAHNKELPSKSTGFVQHVQAVDENATAFLTFSTLYSLTFVVLIHLRTDPKVPVKWATDLPMLLAFILVFVVAIASTIAVIYAPKLMLRRILNIWINQSRKKYQEQLMSYYTDEESNADKIKEVNDKIKTLSDEHLNVNDNLLKLCLTSFGVLSPIITFVFTALNKL